MKRRLKQVESQLHENIAQLKMKSQKDYEYTVLTSEIYQAWPGMKVLEYKKHKGIRKELLKYNMIKITLIDLGETVRSC